MGSIPIIAPSFVGEMMLVAERLMKKSIPVTESGCLIWLGFVKEGYGRIGVNYKTEYAHRVSYSEFVGPIPDGMCVLHKCDVPSCINPNHLFLGTREDNVKDMDKKGRRRPGAAFGENHYCSKLCIPDIKEIRGSKESNYVLALRYKVSPAAIYKIKVGKSWKSVE